MRRGIQFWRNSDCPASHGYTASTEENMATFRIGTLVIGWEVTEVD